MMLSIINKFLEIILAIILATIVGVILFFLLAVLAADGMFFYALLVFVPLLAIWFIVLYLFVPSTSRVRGATFLAVIVISILVGMILDKLDERKSEGHKSEVRVRVSNRIEQS